MLAVGTAATLPSARRGKALRPLPPGEGRGHTVAAARLQLVFGRKGQSSRSHEPTAFSNRRRFIADKSMQRR